MATLKDIAKLLIQKHELKQRDADIFVSAFVDTILEGLKSDRQVKIKGFGTFKVTAVRDRESVNVNTGERVVISGHDKISFTPDAVMRDIVNKPFAQFETVILADGVNFEDITDSSDSDETAENQENTVISVAGLQTSEPDNVEVTEEKVAPETQSSDNNVVIPLVSDASAVSILDETAGISSFGEEVKVENEDVNAQTEELTVVPIAAEEMTETEESLTVGAGESSVGETSVGETEVVTGETEESNAETIEVIAETEDVNAEVEGDNTEAIEASTEVETESNEAETLLKSGDNEETEASDSEKDNVVTPVQTVIAPVQTVVTDETKADNEGYNETDNDEDDEDESSCLSECKRLFVIYAIVTNILIAALAFIIGFLCSDRKWINFTTNNVEEKPQAEIVVNTDSIENAKRQQKEADSIRIQDSINAANQAIQQQVETPQQPVAQLETQKPAQTEEQKPQVEPEKPKVKPEEEVVDPTKYHFDVRVRTGAYNIVGTKKVVKVKPGETLQSISKTILGSGMECYVEAFNGGIKEVKPGQTLKIPELRIKRAALLKKK